MRTITLDFGNVMFNYNRVQGSIKSINAIIDANGVKVLNFDTYNSTRNRLSDVKKWLSKRPVDIPYRPKYNVGQKVIYFNSNPYRRYLVNYPPTQSDGMGFKPE